MQTLLTAVALSLAALPAAAADATQIARGGYMVRIMDCAGCHMPRDATGAPVFAAGLSGGTIGFEMPGIGIFWPPNLTPDATGLGGWSSDQIVTALRQGQRPDGRMLAPVMPWGSFAGLTDEDAQAIAAFLQSLPPVANPVPGPLAAGAPAPAPFFRVVLPQ